MKVKLIVNEFLANTIAPMHKSRREALAACIESAINGNSLTVTGIGRGIDSDTYEKHSIKRCDRLCSNTHLFREKNTIYGAICKLWVPATARPVILVDWSDLDDCKNAFLISATLVCDGRPVTLYLEVHPLEGKELPSTHQHFLKTLKEMLPENCHPIIVADAGFKVPWHQLVLSLGWDYVGRVRKPNHCRPDGEDWQKLDDVFENATSTPKSFKGLLTESKQFETTFVLYKQGSKGRHKFTAEGNRCGSKHSEQHAKGGSEPWLLATSLPVTSTLAKRVVNIYSGRMQIEESYRDMKSSRYGLGFNHSESRNIRRIAILMLIAILAALVLIMVGAAAEQAGFAKHFQANTIKERRVLSLHYLGQRMFAQKRLVPTRVHYIKGIEHMKYMIAHADSEFNQYADIQDESHKDG